MPAAVTFVVILIAAVGFTYLVTPVYESDCMLLISSGGGMSFLSDIGALRELSTFSKTGTPLDTQIELVQLTPRLQECIDELDLRDAEGKPLEPDDLLDKINVLLYENTDIIQVKAYDRSPELARDIAQFLAQNHLKVETEKDKAAALTAYGLLEKKVAAIKSDLDQVDGELADFMEREGIIDVQSEARAQVEGLADLESEYYTLRAELAGLRARRMELESQLATVAPTVLSAITMQQNPEMLDLQKSLNGAEIKLATLLTQYTENYPDVISTRKQIEGLRSRIGELAAKIVSSETESPNPAYQQATRDYATALALEKGQVEQLASVKSVLDLKKSQLTGFADKEIEYLTLTRRQKVLETIYGTAKARMEELPLSTEGLGISTAGSIVKDAQVPERPIAPNKIVNLLAGFIIGLLLALLIAIGLDYSDNRLRGAEEIIKAYALKNLGTFNAGMPRENIEGVYGNIIAALSLAGKSGRTVAFLRFGSSDAGLDALISIAGVAARSCEVSLAVFDHEEETAGRLMDGGIKAGNLAACLSGRGCNSVKHPDGFGLIAPDGPYPIDLIFGDGINFLLDALGKVSARAFILAPTASHAPAATLVCSSCDGTVLLVDPSRTSRGVFGNALREIRDAGGTIAGFVITT